MFKLPSVVVVVLGYGVAEAAPVVLGARLDSGWQMANRIVGRAKQMLN